MWTHGDFVSIHPITKQIVFHGRADGVLNPSGVRFGSAEIYRVLEGQFSKEIGDSICVGQRRPTDTDERVMLFLLMRPGVAFTSDLVARVNSAIRTELSPRHVPMFTFETPEIPVRTFIGKKGSSKAGLTQSIVTDHGQSEKGGAPCEADSLGKNHSALGYTAESEELGLLLSIRQGGNSAPE